MQGTIHKGRPSSEGGRGSAGPTWKGKGGIQAKVDVLFSYTANVLSGKIPEKNSVHLCTGILTGVIHVTNRTGKSRYFYFPTFYRSCQFQWKILSKTGFWSKAVTWISLIWQWIFPGKVSEFICILPWNTLTLAGIFLSKFLKGWQMKWSLYPCVVYWGLPIS